MAQVHVLAVCTANICRSPMAEYLMRSRFEPTADDRQQAFVVSSAGFLEAGRPIAPMAVDVLSDRGIDAAGHRSSVVTAELLAGSDLIVVMTGAHLSRVVDELPGAWPRSFVMLDVVRRVRSIGPRRSDEAVTDYVARLHAGRTAAAVMAAGERDDVRDPYGGPVSEYRTSCELLDRACSELTSALAPESIEPATATPSQRLVQRAAISAAEPSPNNHRARWNPFRGVRP